jgi:hypothetical protein
MTTVNGRIDCYVLIIKRIFAVTGVVAPAVAAFLIASAEIMERLP